jgi:hypothetical protein
VNVVEVATPLAFVVSVSVFVPFPKVPLAPEIGAVNVMDAPLTGEPPWVTVAVRGSANGVLTVVLCRPPLVAVIEMTGGGDMILCAANTIPNELPELTAATNWFVTSSESK